MSHQSKRTTITNRQLNFTLSPVDLHNPKEMPYSLSNYAIDGTWNQYQAIVLDVLLDRIFKAYYDKYQNIPKSWRSPSVVEVNENFAGYLFHPVTLKFLSGKSIEAFSINEGNDVVATERDNYDRMSDEAGKKASFEEHFQEYLQNNYSYQEFIKEKTGAVETFQWRHVLFDVDSKFV